MATERRPVTDVDRFAKPAIGKVILRHLVDRLLGVIVEGDIAVEIV
jgi:hypothetical protein